MVLLVPNPTPLPRLDAPSSVGRTGSLLHYDHVRIYVPLLVTPLDNASLSLQTASLLLVTTRTQPMLERIDWWIGTNEFA